MIQFRRDSQAVLILKYLCLCGEFPWQSVYLLPANEVTLRRTILKMRKEKYLTVLGSGEYKTIRMTKKAFPVLENFFPELLRYYMLITNNHHFRGGVYKNNNVGQRQTWRRHRMAEALCVFGELDCKLLPIEKPILVDKITSPANISALVERIVAGKIADGQLTDADISLREIATVKETMKSYLQQMYHSRISYPHRKNKAK